MTRTGKKLMREQCYGPQDLSLGAFIHVYGRDFFIHDADDFTKHWYSVSACAQTALDMPMSEIQPQAGSNFFIVTLMTSLSTGVW